MIRMGRRQRAALRKRMWLCERPVVRRTALAYALLAGAMVLNAPQAHAQHAWHGATNVNWFNTDNWASLNDTVPGTSDVVEIEVSSGAYAPLIIQPGAVTGDLLIGRNTAATLDVVGNDASLVTHGFADLYGSTGRQVIVTVRDGALWDIRTLLRIGASQDAPGANGNARLSLSDGARLLTRGVAVGTGTGAVGQLELMGGSRLENTSSFVQIGGNGGHGVLRVISGSELHVNTNIQVGTTLGNGLLEVDGAGSRVETTHMWLGADYNQAGTGEARVTNGGYLSVALDATIAGGVDNVGTLVLSGIGSAVDAQNLNIGEYGVGSVEINDGARFGTGRAEVGARAGSTGSVRLSGPGSRWGALGNVNGAPTPDVNIGLGGSGLLEILDGAQVHFRHTILGALAGSEGTARMDGGALWHLDGILRIGDSGQGRVELSGAAHLQTGAVEMAFSDVDARGNLLIDDASLRVLGLLDTGTGVAEIIARNGASIETNELSIGNGLGHDTIVLEGAGSDWVNRSWFSIGGDGTGELTVRDGALFSSNNGWIGGTAGSEGKIRVEGVDTRLLVGNVLEIGGYGTGRLDVLDEAEAVVERLYIGTLEGGEGSARVTSSGRLEAWSLEVGQRGNGLLEIDDGGRVDGGIMRVGRGAGNHGEVRIGQDGFLTGTLMTLGDNTGVGHLFVEAGGEASIGGDMILGMRLGSVGTAVISGADARLQVTNDLMISDSGVGTMNVVDGAELSVSGNTRLGMLDDGMGTLTVSGANSSLNTSSLLVGLRGSGQVTVTDGGYARASYLFAGNLNSGYIGVNGTGSLLQVGTFGLLLGDQNSGRLLVENGARVDVAGDSILGYHSNGTGIVEVSGTGSMLAHTGNFDIGLGGNGLLIVGPGATLQAGATSVSTLGYGLDGTGTARINGNWHAGQHLQIGREGVGELILGNGGTVSLEDGGEVRLGMAGAPFGAFGGIYIGGYQNEAPAAAGFLDVDDIHFQSGALVFNHISQDYGFAARLHGGNGNGEIGVRAGHTRLTGDSSGYAGVTHVDDGRLSVDGTLGGNVFVHGGGLGGAGRIGGHAVFDNAVGTTTLHGVQGQVLRIDGNLQLQAGTHVQAALGSEGGAGLFDVGGDLVLDGTLDVIDVGGFGAGIYRLFDYGGALTDNGLELGVLPGWADASALSVQTSIAQQVNLVSELDAQTTFWDGGDSALWGNGQVDGGDGTWRADVSSFTDSTGTATGPMQPVPGFVVFGATAGTVTVDNSQGNARVAGMQFASDGYVLQGDAIELAQADAVIRVGNGSASGAGYVARLDSALTGTGGLVKSDYGTLLLAGHNTYAGTTVVRNGMVRLVEGGTLAGASATIGESFGQSAAMEVDGTGTAWNAGGDLTVGAAGSGMLTIADQAQVTAAGRTRIGRDAGSEGQLSLLHGAQLMANGAYLHVGSSGRGELLLEDNSMLSSRTTHIGSLAGGQGIARLRSGSQWMVDGVLAIGWNGQGTLHATQGSRIESTYGAIASGNGSRGEVTIDASEWLVDGYLSVGGSGNGALTVSNGGHVASGAGMVGEGTSAMGVARVEGVGSRWDITNDLEVALDGAGDLLVADGGQVTVGGDAYFGQYSGGDIVVRGANSQLNVAGNALVGGEGAVVLALNDGSRFSAASVTLAESAGSFGLLLIGGDIVPAGTGMFDVATMQLGDGDARIVFNHTGNAYRFDTDLTGNGTMQVQAGTTIFGGQANGNIATQVQGGTLRVDGLLSGTTQVQSGGRLGGSGSIAGTTTVQAGGTLLGVQGQTLGMETLVLEAGAVVDAALGMANGAAGLFDVTGDLVLDGTLNVTNAGGFGPGVYRLFDYGGALTDNGLEIGSVPGGVNAAGLTVQTSVAQQVNLLADGGSALDYLFWDGDNSALWNNGQVDGGNGIWRIGTHSFTSVDGSGNGDMQPRPGFAIFQGTSGTVTVDNAGGDAQVTGMQFASDGYVVEGDAIALAGDDVVIRVGDGSAAGANWTATIHSDLSGSGDLVKTDLGTLVLTGNNSYAGNTRVDGGTLVGDAGSIRGHLVNNATAVFNLGNHQTYTGNISGTGNLHKTGTAELELAGTSSLDWSIEEGGIVTAANRFDGDADIASSAWLAFYQNGTSTYAGRLTGAGEFDVEDGHVRLTGNSSTFTGSTWVGNATLEVNDTLGGTLDIDHDARLMGSGTVGSTTVLGVLAPGNSIGTLNVNGDLVFRNGATYEAEVDAAGNGDRVAVSGRATLEGGSVLALASGGNYAMQTAYTILTAGGGVDGTFGSINSNLAFLTPSLAYAANAVTLTLDRNDVAFPDVALTPNQQGAASGAEPLGMGNPIYDTIVTLDAGDARHAFDQLSGEIHASAARMLADDSRFIREASLAQARDAFIGTALQAKHQDERSGWVRGYGAWGSQASDGNAAKLERSTLGLLMGGDIAVGSQWRVGGALGYRQSMQTARVRNSSADGTSYELAAYAGWQSGGWGVRFGASHAWNGLETNRNVVFNGYTDRTRADYDARTSQAFVELGRALDVGGVLVEPFINLAQVRVSAEAFAERGGDAALAGRLVSVDDTFGTLGVRSARDIGKGNAAVTLRGSLSWRHAFGSDAPEARLAFGGGDAFDVYGLAARDVAQLDLAMEGDVAKNAKLGLSYNGVYGGGTMDNGLRLTFNWQF